MSSAGFIGLSFVSDVIHDNRALIFFAVVCATVASVLTQRVRPGSKRVREAIVDGVWIFGVSALTVATFRNRPEYSTTILWSAFGGIAVAVVRFFTAKRA